MNGQAVSRQSSLSLYVQKKPLAKSMMKTSRATAESLKLLELAAWYVKLEKGMVGGQS